jgi:hypothetical protein
MMDSDGYPTREELNRIEDWPVKDHQSAHDLIEYCRSLWSYPDRFVAKTKQGHGRPVIEYYLSTGGWSGNESVVESMQKCPFFWFVYWQQSRRGGHYWFEIPAIVGK